MERRRIQESGEGTMKGLLKGALAVGGGLVGAEVARRTLFWGARPRYEPWQRAPYQDFPNKVLILGGGSRATRRPRPSAGRPGTADRKSVVLGTSVDLGGRRIIKKHNQLHDILDSAP